MYKESEYMYLNKCGLGGYQMYFMVDMENTGSQGLQGTEYLMAEDCITLFFSQSCRKIEQGKLQDIWDSGCKMKICPLKNPGKNALDFYIASGIGEIYGTGYEGMTVIVSGDKGFQAVQDYWRCCTSHPRRIILRKNIELGILASNENSERRKTIQRKLQETDLETEYRKQQERMRIRKELEEEFADTEYAGMIGQIAMVVEGKKDNKVLYLDSLKQFGRKKGVEIYHRIKQVV